MVHNGGKNHMAVEFGLPKNEFKILMLYWPFLFKTIELCYPKHCYPGTTS